MVLVALELTGDILARLRREPAPVLLVTHHPLLFRPVTEVCADDPVGRQVLALARLGHALVACHTNWDKAASGNDDALAAAIGLKDTKALEPSDPDLRLLTVDVPPNALDRVRRALVEAGAGETERYRQGSFSVTGESRFEAKPGAHPATGGIGETVCTPALRLTMITPKERLEAVLSALRRAHPYEEPALSVIRLEADGLSGGRGLGRVGSLDEDMPFDAFVTRVLEVLHAPAVRVSGAMTRTVRRAATVSGSGRSLIDAAARADADVLVTADIGHHDARRAEDLGLAVIDAGHRETEEVGTRVLAKSIQERFPGVSVEFMRTAPAFRFVVRDGVHGQGAATISAPDGRTDPEQEEG